MNEHLVPSDSPYYIARPIDPKFYAALVQRDSLVLVKGAPCMGRTSLLHRGLQKAREAGARTVITDFRDLDGSRLASSETLLLALAEAIANQLSLEVRPADAWNERRGANVNFERYLRKEILEKAAAPFVWGIDEVDLLFTRDFGSEIFGLFRSWHNKRSLDPGGPWSRLTLAIAYATEAHLFITDVNQSPFNVGTKFSLDDFTLEDVAELNGRYGSPLKSGEEVARFCRLVGGHPYLVNRGLEQMVSRGMGLGALEAEAAREDGLFGEHLLELRARLDADGRLRDGMRGVLKGESQRVQESFYDLRSAGLIRGDSARDARPRCPLYAAYFRDRLA